MQKCFLLLLASAILFFVPRIFPQVSKIRFVHISTEQGISNPEINSVVQDTIGFLWFGTVDGLNRFDGSGIKVYRHNYLDKKSLTDNWILQIYRDKKGNIWVGTLTGGLNRYDYMTDSFTGFQFDPHNPNSISGNAIADILEDRDGYIWIATEWDGLNRYDPRTGEFKRYKNDPANPNSLSSNQIRCLYQDTNGDLYVGTLGAGINRLLPDGSFLHFRNNPEDTTSLSSDRVWTMFEDRQGNFWVGTHGGGLNLMNRLNGSFVRFQHNPENPYSIGNNLVTSIIQDSQGTLWVGTEGAGLQRFDPKNASFEKYKRDALRAYSLQSDVVWSLYEDSGSNIWVATNDGMHFFNRRSESIKHYFSDPEKPDGLNNNSIRAILKDSKDRVWIGTLGGGLNVLDTKTNTFSYYYPIPNDPSSLQNFSVSAIYEDRQGRIWVGTWGGGLHLFNEKTHSFFVYKNSPENPKSLINDIIQAIFQDYEGHYWIGTNHGLDRLDPVSGEFTHYTYNALDSLSLSNNSVQSNCIAQNKNGTLWIGTFEGLNLLDPRTGKVKRYFAKNDQADGLNESRIISLYDAGDTLWIGTFGGGINLYDKITKTFEHFTTDDGLPSNIIYTIVPDKNGNIWVSTNSGLSKFNSRTRIFSNYDIKDGLQANQFFWGAGSVSHDGELFFGGINGFNSFYPEKISERTFSPKVVLTNLLVFGTPFNSPLSITAEHNFTFSYDNNFLTFEFASLDYSDPEMILYRYRLEGVDPDWRITNGKNSHAAYTALSPGEYTFEVHATNSDGVWSSHVLSVDVIINPPFWLTWWFRIPAGLFALGVIGFIIISNIGKQKKQRLRLENLVEKRTFELKESETQYRMLAENMADILWLFSMDNFSLLYVSPSVSMLGYPPDKILRKKPIDLFTYASLPVIISILEQFRFEEFPAAGIPDTPQRAELELRLADDSAIWMEWVFTPLRDESGAIRSIQAVSRDITERLEAESALRKAKTEAERANLQKSLFLANMSHEIRTPINAILGFTEILEQSISDAKLVSYLHTIASSGTLLLRLINDILDLSKMEAEKLVLKKQPVKLLQILSDLENMFRYSIQSKDVSFRLNLAEDLPAVLILDEVRFRQILLNLLGNAVKFTHEGFVLLDVSFIPEEKKDDSIQLIIKVIDTGIGIPEDQLDIIFEAFRQQSGQDQSKYGGTGLGLSITRRLIQIMGGKITCESVVAKGTTFTVILPDVEVIPEVQSEAVPDSVQEENSEQALEFGSAQASSITLQPSSASIDFALVLRFEKLFYDEWKQISHTLLIDQIESFAFRVKSEAAKENALSLVQWADSVLLHCDAFDMDALPRTLKEFPAILSALTRV